MIRMAGLVRKFKKGNFFSGRGKLNLDKVLCCFSRLYDFLSSWMTRQPDGTITRLPDDCKYGSQANIFQVS